MLRPRKGFALGEPFSNFQPSPAPSVPWWTYQNSLTVHGKVQGPVVMDSTLSPSKCLDKRGQIIGDKCVTLVTGPRGAYQVIENLGPETTFRYNT